MQIRNRAVLVLALLLILLSPLTGGAADAVSKIAVAANGPEPDSLISREAGRAKYYLFFDTSGALLAAEENPARKAIRNAGPSAARFLIENKTTLVIAGVFGRKMARALEENGINSLTGTGPADKAVRELAATPAN